MEGNCPRTNIVSGTHMIILTIRKMRGPCSFSVHVLAPIVKAQVGKRDVENDG